jgi:hypothetical protein
MIKSIFINIVEEDNYLNLVFADNGIEVLNTN